MTGRWLLVAMTAAWAVAVPSAGAWGESQSPGAVDPRLNVREDSYLNRQAQALLDVVKETLTRCPPQYPEPNERRMALLLLDGVLHDVYAAHRPPVQQFFHAQLERALTAIENAHVTQGAMIWKLYNMGFIVRTQTATIAFDLVRGDSAKAQGFALSDEIMNRFVAQCDALFISHRHDDHVDERVAQAFLDQGKPVVAPPEVWADKPVGQGITRLQREAHTLQSLPIQKGTRELKVVVYPGHQMRNVQNNVSLVFTPEGISFCHLGDQINEGDFMEDYAWIDEVAKHQRVDVLIPNCWTNEIYRIVQGFDPKLVIPGHENEMGHPIDDRVPFWGDSEYLLLTYPELRRSRYPLVVMTWGESLQYTPRD